MADGCRLHMDMLCEICVSALYERDARVLLERALETLDVRGGLFGGVCFLRQGDTLKVMASRSQERGEYPGVSLSLGQGVWGRVYQSGCCEVQAESDGHAQVLAVPMMRCGHASGVLGVRCKSEDQETLTELQEFLQRVGEVLAEALEALHQRGLERDALRDENRSLRRGLDGYRYVGTLLGNSHRMQKVHEQVKEAAQDQGPRLIRGHAGTGKALVAKAIQQFGSHPSAAFETVRCEQGFPSESGWELWGYERQAGTGAESLHRGLLETCGGGTVFLEEISGLSMTAQQKLLDALVQGRFSRLGGTEILPLSCRFMAASSVNLEGLTEEGAFLPELYAYFQDKTIVLPDLKDRRSDIMLLTEHFIQQFNERHNRRVRRLSTPTINMLVAYHWPGNVRELENCIEQAVLSSMGDTIHGYNLPAALQTGCSEGEESDTSAQADFHTKVASYERELIIAALKRANGKMSAAAVELGISPRVMHYKLRLHGIAPGWYKKN